MTEVQQAQLKRVIEALIAKIKRYHGRSIGEQNTKASLIEPLLEALDWDTRDLDEVHREYKSKRSDKPVDFALQLHSKARLFVEAKGLGEDLADRRWVSQVVSYAAVAGVTWCVVTNGDEYRFYNAAAPVDAEDKLFCRFRLTEDSVDELTKTLFLISKAGLEAGLLDKHWKSHFVDRRVNAALRDLVSNASPGLVRLIRHDTPELSRKEIVDSIQRLDVKIDPPPAWSDNSSIGRTDVPEARQSRKGKKSRNPKGKRQAFSVTLKEMIAAGTLSAPLRLFRKYKQQILEATLQRDGTVEFNGQVYDTCSAAAENARATIMGRRMNTNGWQFWQFTDDSGKKRDLIDARTEFIESKKR